MARVYNGNITKCYNCNAFVEYEDSDIYKVEKSYGVMDYPAYMAKIIICPKCGNKIEIY